MKINADKILTLHSFRHYPSLADFDDAFKGTVCKISYKDGNTPFTYTGTIEKSSLKSGKLLCFSHSKVEKCFFLNNFSNQNNFENTTMSFNAFLIIKAFLDTVVNRALPYLHGGSLKITRTVPLIDLNDTFNSFSFRALACLG